MTADDLRAALIEQRMTQLELARRLRINPRTVRRYVLGECGIRPPVADAIEKILGPVASLEAMV